MEARVQMQEALAAALTQVEAVLTADPMVQTWRLREEAGLGQVMVECLIRGHRCRYLLSHLELTILTPAGITADIVVWLERVKREVCL